MTLPTFRWASNWDRHRAAAAVITASYWKRARAKSSQTWLQVYWRKLTVNLDVYSISYTHVMHQIGYDIDTYMIYNDTLELELLLLSVSIHRVS